MTILSLYRNWILSLLVVCLLAGITTGSYYYRAYERREAHYYSASHDYENLLQITKNQSTIDVDQAVSFIEKYQHTPYVALLQLHLASQAVKANQLKEAIAWLQAAAAQSKDTAIAAIARQRGARILLLLKEFKTALQWLDAIDCDAYAALTEEIKGDVFHALGDKEKARKAYHRAYEIDPALFQHSPLLQLKINDLE